MEKVKFDPGLTQQYSAPLRRAINKDGTFNVARLGTSWHDVHPYLHLVSISWPRFFLTLLTGYIAVNAIFAVVYYALGPNALQGDMSNGRFMTDFYFSSQTLTTVGFGHIAPKTHPANIVAAMEALCGLLGFAVATGLLFGRVSRPSARIGFSDRALIVPYQDGMSLQFRLVNRRENSLTELEATVMLMTVDRNGGGSKRTYDVLKLERDKVYFFPLTWTVVHPLDEDSPLRGKTPADLEQLQAELLIMVKAWDETFAQTVRQRYSYRFDEIVWNARFSAAFEINKNGNMDLYVDRVGDHARITSQT
ncbi:MAG TPA: ion channel [Bryobacteraceae bacterium]|nr:ion channel [Bryobacteraceae bacterium]